jgi:aerobic-type carbon monoxide dehydrogenase small subunit (CoxS/CutS family)
MEDRGGGVVTPEGDGVCLEGARMKRAIRFHVNGRPVTLDTGAERTLLWVLRGDLELTGTKYGCGAGVCGSCTVVVGGRAVRSCQATLGDVEGKDVLTIEGLSRGDTLHPLQRAFVDHGALQCGYCTPGMLMSAYALLRETPRPSPARIAEAMEDNLCRCGAHKRILAAIAEVSREGARP